jgi:uncharacterized peroxidase-related enzyme
MTFIRTIAETDATGQLADLYRGLAYRDAAVDETYKALSLNPALLAADAAMYDTTMYGESPLSRGERELLALTVSHLNGCVRCFRHHSARYAGLVDGASNGQPEALADSALSERQRVLVTFAEKLTVAPAGITAADIGALRRVGLDDRGVLDACNTVAYFSYANRMTFGLGLETEPQGSGPSQVG